MHSNYLHVNVFSSRLFMHSFFDITISILYVQFLSCAFFPLVTIISEAFATLYSLCEYCILWLHNVPCMDYSMDYLTKLLNLKILISLLLYPVVMLILLHTRPPRSSSSSCPLHPRSTTDVLDCCIKLRTPMCNLLAQKGMTIIRHSMHIYKLLS